MFCNYFATDYDTVSKLGGAHRGERCATNFKTVLSRVAKELRTNSERVLPSRLIVQCTITNKAMMAASDPEQ